MREKPITQAEQDAFNHFFAVHPELDTPGNGKLFTDYLFNTWGVDVTDSAMSTAWGQLRAQLEVRSAIRINYDRACQQDMDAANKLYAWMVQPNQHWLVAAGDQGMENMTKLLAQLRGREITSASIHEAMGRVSYSKGLHFAPVQQQHSDPRRHEDDGKPFMPKHERSKYRADGKIDHAFEKSSKPVQPAAEATPDAWKKIIEGQLQNGTHGEQAEAKRLYELLTAKGFQPRQISTELSKLQRSYQRLFSPKAV